MVIFILNSDKLTILAILTLFSGFLPLISKGGGINDGTYLKERERETLNSVILSNFIAKQFLNMWMKTSQLFWRLDSQNARCKTEFCKHQKYSSNKES